MVLDYETSWDTYIGVAREATWDTFLGSTQLTTSFDAILIRTDAIDQTWDAYVTRAKTASWDTYVYEATGAYRGTMPTAERDVLPKLVPGDHVISLDAGVAPREHFWNGSEWLEGMHSSGSEQKQERKYQYPSQGNWRVELGDPAEPLRLTDGSDRPFSVDEVGGVAATRASLRQFIDLSGTPTPAIRQVASWDLGTLTPTGTANHYYAPWLKPTVAGSLLLCVVKSDATGAVAGYTKRADMTFSVFVLENAAAGRVREDITQPALFGIVTLIEVNPQMAFPSFDKVATTTGAVGVTPTVTSAATDTATEFVLSVFHQVGAVPLQVPVGYAPISQRGMSNAFGSDNQVIAYKTTTTTGAQSATSGGQTTVWNAAVLTFRTLPGVETPADTHGRLYVREISSVPHLMFMNDVGSELDLSAGAAGVADHNHQGAADGGALSAPYIDDYFDIVERSGTPPAGATSGRNRLFMEDTSQSLFLSHSSSASPKAPLYRSVWFGSPTVANSTTQDALASSRSLLPRYAGLWRAEWGGRLSHIATSGSLTFRIRIWVNGTPITVHSTLVGNQASAQSDVGWWLEAGISVDNVTSSGVVTVSSFLRQEMSSVQTVKWGRATGNLATTAPEVELTAQWGTANAGNSIELGHGVVKLVELY